MPKKQASTKMSEKEYLDSVADLKEDLLFFATSIALSLEDIQEYKMRYLQSLAEHMDTSPALRVLRPTADYVRQSLESHATELTLMRDAAQELLMVLHRLDKPVDLQDATQQLREMRFKFRVIKQTLSVTLTASRWQAHDVARTESGFSVYSGFDQIREQSPYFEFNYARWHSRLIKRYEKTFRRVFYTNTSDVDCLLVNSGMAAIALAFEVMYMHEQSKAAIGRRPRMTMYSFKDFFYSEAGRAIQRFAGWENAETESINIIGSSRADWEQTFAEFTEILRAQVQLGPFVPIVFCDRFPPQPSKSHGTWDILPLKLLRDAIDAAGVATAYILIDTTRTGPSECVRQTFRGTTCRFHVFEVESLAKYHLYGADFTDGGILVMPEHFQRSFMSYGYSEDRTGVAKLLEVRANNGQSFPEYLIRALPKPDKARFYARMGRMHRNAALLTDAINKSLLANDLTDLVTVFHLGSEQGKLCDVPTCNCGAHSTLVFVQLERGEAKKCARLLSLLLADKGVSLPIRGSYGFDRTSIDVFSKNRLRFSVGTETKAEMLELCAHLSTMLSNDVAKSLLRGGALV